MKRLLHPKLLGFVSLLVLSSALHGQITFRSVQNGDWDDASTWKTGAGAGGTEGVDYPSRFDSVFVDHAVDITAFNEVSVFVFEGYMEISSAATLESHVGDNVAGFTLRNNGEMHVFGTFNTIDATENPSPNASIPKEFRCEDNAIFIGYNGSDMFISDDWWITENCTVWLEPSVCANVSDDVETDGTGWFLCGGGDIRCGGDGANSNLGFNNGAGNGFICASTVIYRNASSVACSGTQLSNGTATGGFPPTAYDDFFSSSYNTSAVHRVLRKGVDDRHPIIGDTITLTSAGSNAGATNGATNQGGTVTINNNGTPLNPKDDYVFYTPPLNFSGVDTYNYLITEEGGATDIATVTVFVACDGGQFVEAATQFGLQVSTGAKDGGFTWYDFNRDNLVDVIVNTSNTTTDTRLYYQQNSGNFTDVTATKAAALLSNNTERSVIAGDLDNDGYVDFVRHTFNRMEVWLNNGPSSTNPYNFTLTQTITTNSEGINLEGITFVDWDQDGFLDLMMDNDDSEIIIFENDQDGTFTEQTAGTGLPTGNAGIGDYATSIDWNNDGFSDFAARKSDGATSDFWEFNPGTGQFVAVDPPDLTTAGGEKGGITFCDVDQDGDFDFIWAHESSTDNTSIYLQQADGSFTLGTNLVNDAGIEDCDCGDVDNDGDNDIFLSDDAGTSYLYINNTPAGGALSFTQDNECIDVDEDAEACEFVDIDNDGDVDLYINIDADNNQLYVNTIDNNNFLIVEPRVKLNAAGNWRPATGANVMLTEACGGDTLMIKDVSGGRGHGSQKPAKVHFGLGGNGLSGPTGQYQVQVFFLDSNGTRDTVVRTVRPDRLLDQTLIVYQSDESDSCFLDFDGDGIGDEIDLDDDNDGVLDLDEGRCPGEVSFNFFDNNAGNSVFNIPVSGGLDSGLATTFDVDSLQNAVDPGDANTFSVRYSGFITIATTGTYTFYTNSDDGSALYIDTFLVVDNDGLQAANEESGTIVLAAGTYPLTVLFFENTGQEILEVQYEGPSIIKQDIPFDILSAPCAEGNDTDGDGLLNRFDLDSDNDGISDHIEGGSNGTDANNDGIVDGNTDADGDGVLESADSDDSAVGSASNFLDTDGDGFANSIDIDSDGDGIIDNIEAQLTASSVEPSGNDSDFDGIDDSFEPSTFIPIDTDSNGTPDYLDLDSDGDGYLDALEGYDADGDFLADTTASGADSDGDGLDDAFDEFNGLNASTNPSNNGQDGTDLPNVADPGTPERDWREPRDTDGDGVIDLLDIDNDNDGVLDSTESDGNLPFGDEDGDGIINWLDLVDNGNGGDGSSTDYTDLNGNGFPDVYEADEDGIPNFFDYDSDNDGIPDLVESFGVDTDGDGLVDVFVDTDGDGLADAYDPDNGGDAIGAIDSDGDGLIDAVDRDSDGDGIPDVIEAGGVDENGDGELDGSADTDNDGLFDVVDGDVGNDGTAENSANALQLTGTDGNSDGIPDSYPEGDTDGDGVLDQLDLDSDSDGIPDVVEAGGVDDDGDGRFDDTTDDDNDGLADVIDGLRCVTSDVGGSYVAGSSNGIVNGTNANGTADGTFAQIYDPTDVYVHDLGQVISAGSNYSIVFRRKATYGAGPTADIVVEESLNPGSGYSTNSVTPQDATQNFITFVMTAESNLRYIRITTLTGTNDDIDLDAITFSDTACSSGQPLIVTGADGNADGAPDNIITSDQDDDGIYNHLDLDSDGDGIADVVEAGGTANVDGTINVASTDTDGDGLADAIDGDVGNDGTAESSGNALTLTGTDGDADGRPDINPNDDVDSDDLYNFLDLDSDGDGIVDLIEAQVTTSTPDTPGGTDSDSDGIDNSFDSGNAGALLDPIDTDSDGTADYLDTDSDGDGEDDILEGWDTNGDGTAETVAAGTDSDSDGLDDNFDDVVGPNITTNITNGGQDAFDFPNADGGSDERDWRETPCVGGTVQLVPNNATTTAAGTCRKDNFVYYFNPSDSTELLFAIEQYPVAGNTSEFDATANITVSIDPLTESGVYRSTDAANEQATFVMGRYWNVTINSGSLDGNVRIRFFYDTEESDTLLAVAQRWNQDSASGTAFVSGLRWFTMNNGQFDPATDMTPAGIAAATQIAPDSIGTEDGVSFVQFDLSPALLTGGGLAYTVNNNSVILPVELLNFQASALRDRQSLIQWSTSTEVNSDFFEVERTHESHDWISIGRLEAAGNSNTRIDYELIDNEALGGRNFYRLRITDQDGSIEYSEIDEVNFIDNDQRTFQVVPNPNDGRFTVYATKSLKGYELTLSNSHGQVAWKKSIDQDLHQIEVNQNQIPAGSYYLMLRNEVEQITLRMIIGY